MSLPPDQKTRGQATFHFPGRASDTEAGILDAGRGSVTAAMLSMSARSETGQDADYIKWHQFDHAPEQFRIDGVRNSQRWVSTPACRAARRAQAAPFDRVDHVAQYLFAEPVPETVRAFMALGPALTAAGRQPLSVPRVQSGAFDVVDKRVNPRSTLGSSVLPWWPAGGVYLTIEPAAADGAERAAQADALARLVAIEGVAGAWRYVGAHRDLAPLACRREQSVVVFYLYDDPVSVADRLGAALEREWRTTGVEAQFAAPFHVVRPLEWDRHLP